MSDHDQADDVVDQLTHWGELRDDVRAILLTSTRAVPDAKLDAYSDYDVILVVADVAALVRQTEWLATFGEVLIAYWDPIETDRASGAVSVGNITQYVTGLKIDFGLWSVRRFGDVVGGAVLIDELDAGYRVLLDKDGLASELAAPTYAAFIPHRPDEETYLRLITDFFIGPPYVAKSLLRGELLPTKWVLDFDMRYTYLLPMLEWRAECDHDWSLKVGNLGKGLKDHLEPDVWVELTAAFTGAAESENWTAMFRMMALFGRVAREVATSLGFTYPAELESRVTEHVQRMRDGVFAAGPLSETQSQ